MQEVVANLGTGVSFDSAFVLLRTFSVSKAGGKACMAFWTFDSAFREQRHYLIAASHFERRFAASSFILADVEYWGSCNISGFLYAIRSSS